MFDTFILRWMFVRDKACHHIDYFRSTSKNVRASGTKNNPGKSAGNQDTDCSHCLLKTWRFPRSRNWDTTQIRARSQKYVSTFEISYKNFRDSTHGNFGVCAFVAFRFWGLLSDSNLYSVVELRAKHSGVPRNSCVLFRAFECSRRCVRGSCQWMGERHMIKERCICKPGASFSRLAISKGYGHDLCCNNSSGIWRVFVFYSLLWFKIRRYPNPWDTGS